MNLYLIIIISAVVGLLLTSNIFYKKRQKKPLVCPLKSDCNLVINSQFSHLFGMPLEILGFMYYGIIASSYSAFYLQPQIQTENIILILLILTTVAFLFSIYLTLIQALALKEWCVWCLFSALLCFVIFLISIFVTHFSLLEVLNNNYKWLTVGMTISLILGVGGSTIYNLLYVKFLKDLKISKLEKETLRTISQVVWISLIVLTASGLGLYLSRPDIYNESASFLIKIFIMFFIIGGEILLNIILAPHLIEASDTNTDTSTTADLKYLRRVSLAVSLTSLVSWYTLLTYIILPLDLEASLPQLISYYLIAVGVAIIISQFIDYILTANKTYDA
ncbi:MAG: vitamin K epoxide reductase family protein [Candidatus Paceibacterota bacterium]